MNFISDDYKKISIFSVLYNIIEIPIKYYVILDSRPGVFNCCPMRESEKCRLRLSS